MKFVPVTVSQLLSVDALPEHRVIGGQSGLNRRVMRVMPCADVHWIQKLPPETQVVFTRGAIRADLVSTDLSIRLAHSVGASALVMEASTQAIPLATEILADRLSIPLITVESMDAGVIVAACDEYVRAPEISALRIVTDAVNRFRTTPSTAQQLISALNRTIHAETAMIDAEGRLLAGSEHCHALAGMNEGRSLISATQPRPGSFVTNDHESVVLQPIQIAYGSANI